MQTSILTPVTLYSTAPVAAQLILPLLPPHSEAVQALAAIPANRRAILLAQSAAEAQEIQHWVQQQPEFRHPQLFFLLPAQAERVNPPCESGYLPFRLPQLHGFLARSTALPPLSEAMSLTETEQRLVSALYTAGESLAHEVLMRQVWGYHEDIQTHTLETHLYRLRKKLEGSGYQIVTEAGRYQWLSSEN